MTRTRLRRPAKSKAKKRSQSFVSRVLKIAFIVYKMPGKWMISVEGIKRPDPRRFKSWNTMQEVLKAEVESYPENAIVRCYRTTTRPTLWACIKWAYVKCYRDHYADDNRYY